VYAVHLAPLSPGTDVIVNSTRRISLATGVLFVTATVAAITAAALSPALTGPDYLTGVAGHSEKVAASALVYLVAAGTSVGIAVALYPLLKKTNAALALGAVVFRTIEAAFYTAGVVSLLSITTLGRQFTAAPAANRPAIQAMADNVLSVRDHSTLVAVFAFSVGSFMYSVVFYRSRLVPRWLSAWGMAGALLIGTACLVSLFSYEPVTGQYLLILPVAVWEMVIAVWLLIKGFSPRTGGTVSTSPQSPQRAAASPRPVRSGA
jgi:hypothetical protein